MRLPQVRVRGRPQAERLEEARRALEAGGIAATDFVIVQNGSVDLVYIDPPFATGNAFALARKLPDASELRLPAFDDAWTDGIAGFLRMLDPRLRLVHELLAPHGSLYVHVDPTVGHAVKLLLDEVFGPASFQREIVWRIGWVSGFKTRARNWIRNHDLVFFYVKDPRRFTFNKRYVPHPEGYLRRARELCTERDVLLVADEIQTGFCRTGDWFACDREGVVPDLVTVAKGMAGGLPLAGVTGRAEVMDAVHVGGLGGTYGGNPVAAAASLATPGCSNTRACGGTGIGDVPATMSTSWSLAAKIA